MKNCIIMFLIVMATCCFAADGDFNYSGKELFLLKYGEADNQIGLDAGKNNTATSIAYKDGKIHILDAVKNRIVVFSENGDYLGQTKTGLNMKKYLYVGYDMMPLKDGNYVFLSQGDKIFKKLGKDGAFIGSTLPNEYIDDGMIITNQVFDGMDYSFLKNGIKWECEDLGGEKAKVKNTSAEYTFKLPFYCFLKNAFQCDNEDFLVITMKYESKAIAKADNVDTFYVFVVGVDGNMKAQFKIPGLYDDEYYEKLMQRNGKPSAFKIEREDFVARNGEIYKLLSLADGIHIMKYEIIK